MTAVQKQYRIGYPKRVTAGQGSVEELREIVERTGAKAVCLMTDRGVLEHGAAERPAEILKSMGRLAVLIPDIPAEPEEQEPASVCERMEGRGIDLVVAVGGGSVMDTAKAAAAGLVNPAYRKQIRAVSEIRRRPVRTVMIPTTSGTGAEVTPNAVFYFPEERMKEGIVSEQFLPDYVILDPLLTAALPPALTASCGIDALCHAVESYLSIMNNPFCTLHSLKAAELITHNIEAAYADGTDGKAREKMQLGAYYAGMCLSTSSTAAVHALAYPLGGQWRIPHGVSNAILLPAVMEAHLDCCGKEFAALARSLPGGEAVPEDERPVWFAEYLSGLTKRLNIPQHLSEFGIGREDLDFLAESASGVRRLLSKNPKALTAADIKKIYERVL